MTSTMLTGPAIAKAIEKANPEVIAVAYLGWDWKTYLPNPEKIESIVISPRLGTNPAAVAELSKVIGWERIYLHDDLHAKLYLGSKSAVLGSANLSLNGLDGGRLVELCAEISAPADLEYLQAFHQTTLEQARKQYSSVESRKGRMAELAEEMQKNLSFINESKKTAPAFKDFDLLAPDQFYVACYGETEEIEHSDEVDVLEEIIEHRQYMASSDEPVKGKWMLLWRTKKDNTPSKSEKPFWMVIDEIIENGVKTETDYPKLVYQRKDVGKAIRRESDAPFELTESVIDAFRSTIVDVGVREHFIQNENIFTLEKTIGGVPELVKRMQAKLVEKKNS